MDDTSSMRYMLLMVVVMCIAQMESRTLYYYMVPLTVLLLPAIDGVLAVLAVVVTSSIVLYAISIGSSVSTSSTSVPLVVSTGT